MEAEKISQIEKEKIRVLDSLFPIIFERIDNNARGNEDTNFNAMFRPSAPIDWQEIIKKETKNELEAFGNF